METAEGKAGRHQMASVLAALLALGVALTVLAFLFPASGDDWVWGSHRGVERWNDAFEGYNGRYLGNVAALGMTRATWLAPFVVAATVCVVVWLVSAIGRLRSLVGIASSTALFLAMPLSQWKQTVTWVSGFTNYTIPCIILLLFVLTVQRDWRRTTWFTGARALLLLPIAVVGQLFMEHITIYLVLASLVNVGVQLRSRGRPSALAIVWLCGTITGASVMFSNSAYRALGGDSYQGIGANSVDTGSTGLWGVVRQGAGGVSQYLVCNSTVLNVVLFGLVVALMLTARRRAGATDPLAVTATVAAGVAVVAGLAVSASIEPTRYYSLMTPWSWVCSLALFVALLLAAWRVVADPVRRREVIALTISVAVLAAPMAAVTPYGPRNFLPTYLLLSCIALILLADLLAQQRGLPLLRAAVLALSAVVAVAILSAYFVVYSVIDRAEDTRLAYLREAAERHQTVATVFTLPFQAYVHGPDPTPGHWARYYKAFYDLPRSLEIRLVDRYRRVDLTPSADAE